MDGGLSTPPSSTSAPTFERQRSPPMMTKKVEREMGNRRLSRMTTKLICASNSLLQSIVSDRGAEEQEEDEDLKTPTLTNRGVFEANEDTRHHRSPTEVGVKLRKTEVLNPGARIGTTPQRLVLVHPSLCTPEQQANNAHDQQQGLLRDQESPTDEEQLPETPTNEFEGRLNERRLYGQIQAIREDWILSASDLDLNSDSVKIINSQSSRSSSSSSVQLIKQPKQRKKTIVGLLPSPSTKQEHHRSPHTGLGIFPA